MAVISLPYEKMNPNAVAYVAGIDNAVAALWDMPNIRLKPVLKGVTSTAICWAPLYFSGSEDDTNRIGILIATSVNIDRTAPFGICFLGWSIIDKQWPGRKVYMRSCR
jgi:hypothetical protein